MARRGIVLLPLAVLFLVAAQGDDPAKEIYKQVVRGTVYLETPDGSGTGWIADRERRLIITNYHVVLKHDTVKVVFPEYKNGELVVERTAYRNATRHQGRVIDAWPDKDLAAVQLGGPLPEGTVALKLANQAAEAAERVHSVGNPGPSRGHWVYTSGVVRQVFQDRWHYLHLAEKIKQNCEARILQTQSPTNGGDSGGPVVNDRGEVIATTSGETRDARIITFFIDVSEVRPFVRQAWRVAEPKTVADHILRGERLISRGQYDDASVAFSAALKLDPKSALAYRGRGQAAYERDDYDTAIIDLDRAIELDAADALAYHYRGASHYYNDKEDLALKDLSRAISLDPKCALACNQRGVLYHDKDEHARAVADFGRAIAADPKDAVFWSNRASSRYRLKEYDQALLDCQESLLIDPFDVRCWHTRGLTLRDKKDYDGHVQNYETALKLQPDHAELWYDLGNAWTWKDQWAQSLPCFARSIQLDPKFPAVYWSRGLALEELERYADAQPDYRKALELAKDDYQDELQTWDTAQIRAWNDSSHTIRIHMQYEYKTKEGKWIWYPQDPTEAPTWTFKPGEKFRLEQDEWVIHCRRCRIWAESDKGDVVWEKYKKADWEMVPREGFLARSRPVLMMRFE